MVLWVWGKSGCADQKEAGKANNTHSAALEHSAALRFFNLLGTDLFGFYFLGN
jgi:hypothetical protein